VRRITASHANTGQAEMISAITVTLTKAKILSALSLSVNGQAGTGNPSPPEVGNEFTFSPSIPLASGASLTFTLKAMIGVQHRLDLAVDTLRRGRVCVGWSKQRCPE
jgi:hypothetical protein